MFIQTQVQNSIFIICHSIEGTQGIWSIDLQNSDIVYIIAWFYATSLSSSQDIILYISHRTYGICFKTIKCSKCEI